jgi:oligoendopeptidase F
MSTKRQQLPLRHEIPEQYRWSVTDIYPSDTAWEDDYRRVEEMIPLLARYRGTLGQSAAQLLACIKAQEEVQKIAGKVSFYASRRKDEDNTNPTYVAMSDRVRNLWIRMRGALSWFTPELLSIPEEKLQAYLAEAAELQTYRQMLDEVLRRKPHVLSAEQEYLLAQAGQVAQAPSTIFNMLNNADIKFPTIIGENGEEVEVTKGRYISLLESKDRRVRAGAFRALHGTYRELRNTLAATFASSVRKDAFLSQARHYESSLHAALHPDNVSIEVYDNLISTIHSNLPRLHNYVGLRKRALGLDELHIYDLYVPIVQGFDMEISYEEGCELVIEALAPFGEEYQATVRRAVEERWIDVYENVGKTSGAYSAGTYGVHPYILLNFQNNINSVFTLAHELGHAMHTYLSQATQPYVYSGYSLFVAEVASTVHEVLLTHYLLGKTDDPHQRAYYLNNYLEGFRGTVFRQTMFAEFEREAHSRSARGEALTADLLSSIYHALNARYYGPDIVVDPEIDIEWARIPHFYRSFYVYKYATGYSAAVALATQILQEGQPAVQRYLDFLRAGSSDYPLHVLKRAGVDMSQPGPIQAAMDEFQSVVSELDQLLR